MPAHKHAALIMQYARDAQETETPWDRWQVKTNDFWCNCNTSPLWNTAAEYRRKPKTIIINSIEVPEPMRVEPPIGTIYYVISCSSNVLRTSHYWNNDFFDKNVLALGVCHLTEESAIKHTKALLSFTKVQP